MVSTAFFGRLTAHDLPKTRGVLGPNVAAVRGIAQRLSVRNGAPAALPPGDGVASPSRVPCESISCETSSFLPRFEKKPEIGQVPERSAWSWLIYQTDVGIFWTMTL